MIDRTVLCPDGVMRLESQLALPPSAMKTYSYHVRRRAATCVEVQCPQYLRGWTNIVPADSKEAAIIRGLSGKYRWTETQMSEGRIAFAFEAGQRCFPSLMPFPNGHTLPWEGYERFIERVGDWRGTVGEAYRHRNADDWIDSSANQLIKVQERRERG